MIFSIYAILAFIVYLLIKNCSRPKGFPPGPSLLPFIGTWYCLPPVTISKDVAAWRKKYGNIIGHKLGFRYIVFVTGREEIIAGSRHPNLQARSSSEFFKKRTFGKRLGFLFAEGPQWEKVRSFTMRYLSQEYNPILMSMMQDEMHQYFRTIKPGEVMKVDTNVMKLQLHIILSMMVGPTNDKLRSEIERIGLMTNKAFDNGRITSVEILYPFTQTFIKNKARAEAVKRTLKFFKDRVAEHKKAYQSNCIRDYVDAFLAEAEKEQGSGTNYFTEEELYACMLDMLQAGNESTEKTINYMLLYVAASPRVQMKIHEEIDFELGEDGLPDPRNKSSLAYLEAVILETMRINSISPLGIHHRVMEDTNIYGYTLPKDTLVFFAHGDTLTNSEYWPYPEIFKPERFFEPGVKEKLTNFGIGRRSCIGETMAKNTIFLFAAYFFQKYRIELPEGEKPDFTEQLGFTLGPKPFNLIISERY